MSEDTHSGLSETGATTSYENEPGAEPEDAGTMTYWLAAAAKEVRLAKGRKARHIAQRLDRDQGTVYRFESHSTQPWNIDVFIAAYAEDTGTTSTAIWKRALDLWLEFGRESTLGQLLDADVVIVGAESTTIIETKTTNRNPNSKGDPIA